MQTVPSAPKLRCFGAREPDRETYALMARDVVLGRLARLFTLCVSLTGRCQVCGWCHLLFVGGIQPVLQCLPHTDLTPEAPKKGGCHEQPLSGRPRGPTKSRSDVFEKLPLGGPGGGQRFLEKMLESEIRGLSALKD